MDGATAPRLEISGAGSTAWPRGALRRFGPLAFGTLAAAALVVGFVRPDEGALPGQDGRTVVDEWYDSIASLGIRAIYPPTEDMHVGDLWAVIIPPGLDHHDLTPSLLSRSVRVGHIDLRGQLDTATRRRPLFAETSPNEESRRESERLRLEVGAEGAGRISLALVSFPTSRVRRTVQVAAEGGTWLGTFGGARTLSLVDEISVPQAYGYGVPVTDAAHALLAWCHETPLRCSASYLEGVMRYALGAASLEAETPDGERPRVELRLVNYVFLARQIEQRRVLEGTVGGGAGFATPRPVGTAEALVNGGPVSADGATVQVSNSDTRGMSVSQTFARPIVIGFRAVTMRPIESNGAP